MTMLSGVVVVVAYKYGKMGLIRQMTNLEIVLLYVVVGLIVTLISAELNRGYIVLLPEDILCGTLCYPIFIVYWLTRWLVRRINIC